MDSAGSDAAEHPHYTPRCVKQGHWVHVHVATADAETAKAETGVSHQSAVAEQRPFREAGRARGVLDLCRVGWPYERQGGQPRGGAGRPVVEGEHIT